jgi:ABC-type nitrate/sulfonate/bicarbonate transport system permease component
MPRKKSVNPYTVISIASVVLLFVLWEFAVRVGLADPGILPSPGSIVRLFIDKLTNTSPDGATIQDNTWFSMKIIIYGYIWACVIGIPLGLTMGFFNPVERFFRPVFEIIRPIPTLAWVPVIVLIFGIGEAGKTFIIFIGSFVSLTINTYTGIKGTKDVLLNVAKTAGASKMQMFFRVGLPSAVPMIFTGLRIALGIAMSTLVAAEMVAATIGLGYMMNQGRRLMDTQLIFLGIVVIGVLGFLANFLMGLLENKIAPWEEKSK